MSRRNRTIIIIEKSEPNTQIKSRCYLSHDEERQWISAAGRERCLRSGYSYHDRLRKILTQIAGGQFVQTAADKNVPV